MKIRTKRIFSLVQLYFPFTCKISNPRPPRNALDFLWGAQRRHERSCRRCANRNILTEISYLISPIPVAAEDLRRDGRGIIAREAYVGGTSTSDLDWAEGDDSLGRRSSGTGKRGMEPARSRREYERGFHDGESDKVSSPFSKDDTEDGQENSNYRIRWNSAYIRG